MRPRLTGALCALMLLGLTPSAWADALIERYSRSDGFAGMGGFEGTTLSTTSATAQREESSLRFTGSVLGALQRMTGGGDTIRITRLDRGLVWKLDPEKKTYAEEPLTARGERERQAPAPGPGPGQRPQKGEPSDVVVTKNEFKVDKTGARKTINRFPCEEYLVTWLVETRNQKTGETGKSVMTTRLWTTPETGEISAATAEEQAYTKAYLRKIGMEMSPEEARRYGMATFAGLTGLGEQEQERALARLRAEMSKVRGYAIVTQVEWNAEGSGGAGAEQPAAGRQGGGQPSPAEVMGQLGKLFGGGQKGGGGESAAGGRGGAERSGALFTLYTEVKSIRTTGAEPTRFEVPTGYTRR